MRWRTGGRDEARRAERARQEENRLIRIPSEFYLYPGCEKYGEKHPDVEIEIKEFSQGEGSDLEGDLAKYVNTTNTELLSGKGADLIALDVSGFPVGKYVDEQALVNLSEWMDKDPDFDTQSYEMNILDGAKIRGGLYTLPLRFFLDSLMGDAKAIEQSGVTFDDRAWTWGVHDCR